MGKCPSLATSGTRALPRQYWPMAILQILFPIYAIELGTTASAAIQRNMRKEAHRVVAG